MLNFHGEKFNLKTNMIDDAKNVSKMFQYNFHEKWCQKYFLNMSLQFLWINVNSFLYHKYLIKLYNPLFKKITETILLWVDGSKKDQLRGSFDK